MFSCPSILLKKKMGYDILIDVFLGLQLRPVKREVILFHWSSLIHYSDMMDNITLESWLPETSSTGNQDNRIHIFFLGKHDMRLNKGKEFGKLEEERFIVSSHRVCAVSAPSRRPLASGSPAVYLWNNPGLPALQPSSPGWEWKCPCVPDAKAQEAYVTPCFENLGDQPSLPSEGWPTDSLTACRWFSGLFIVKCPLFSEACYTLGSNGQVQNQNLWGWVETLPRVTRPSNPSNFLEERSYFLPGIEGILKTFTTYMVSLMSCFHQLLDNVDLVGLMPPVSDPSLSNCSNTGHRFALSLGVCWPVQQPLTAGFPCCCDNSCSFLASSWSSRYLLFTSGVCVTKAPSSLGSPCDSQDMANIWHLHSSIYTKAYIGLKGHSDSVSLEPSRPRIHWLPPQNEPSVSLSLPCTSTESHWGGRQSLQVSLRLSPNFSLGFSVFVAQHPDLDKGVNLWSGVFMSRGRKELNLLSPHFYSWSIVMTDTGIFHNVPKLRKRQAWGLHLIPLLFVGRNVSFVEGR